MGRATCAYLALMLPSCAQLFGIAETTGSTSDAHTTGVTVQMQRITVGPTVVRSPYDVSHLAASWLVADPNDPSGLRRVAATVGTSTDTWSAPITDGSPPVEI